MSETYSDNAAVCPYCDYMNKPEDSDGYLYDEDTTTWECGECEKEFSVDIYKKITWISREIEK